MEYDIIKSVWKRELIKFFRTKWRIFGTLAMPVFYLVIFGISMTSSFNFTGLDQTYLEFIAPGIIGMVILFTSISAGFSTIYDKQFGFMKEMLVAPISRTDIMLGKSFAGATLGGLQGLIMIGVSVLLGVKITSIAGILIAIIFAALVAIGFVGLAIAVASIVKEMQSFHVIMNLFMMPLFFFSAALYPIDNLPGTFKIATMLDPLTYAVDGMRYGFYGVSFFPVLVDFVLLVVFCVATILIGSHLFKKMQN